MAAAKAIRPRGLAAAWYGKSHIPFNKALFEILDGSVENTGGPT